MAGDGEFLGVDLFGDGQREVVPCLITTLLVGRYGIMDLRLDAVGGEECLQFIATLAENGEDMVYGVARFNRIPSRIFAAAESYFHEVAAYFPLITGCNLLAAQVVGIA